MDRQLTAQRRNELAEILLSRGSIRVGESARQFHVSTETIRKDIIYLEKEGIAVKSHGGATIASNMLARPVGLKQNDNSDRKTRIAQKAIELISEHATILLDAGSTNYTLAKLLAREKGLTIFSNSILALHAMAESDNQVFCFGGLISSHSYGIVGKWSNEELRSIHADFAFIGTDGFQGLNGPATVSYEEAEFKSNMIAASDHSIILSDSSKFHSRTLFEFSRWENIDIFITDTDAPIKEVEKLNSLTQVIMV